jgi:hypothetical protein
MFPKPLVKPIAKIIEILLKIFGRERKAAKALLLKG